MAPDGDVQQFQDNLYADDVTSSAEKWLAECHAVLDEVERFKVRPRRIWEVFADEGRTTTAARKLANVEAECFSLQNGCDFRDVETKKKFMRKMRKDMPDEILLAPPCKLWSSMQEINIAQHGEEYAMKLAIDQARDEQDFLKFCREVYDAQRRESAMRTSSSPEMPGRGLATLGWAWRATMPSWTSARSAAWRPTSKVA